MRPNLVLALELYRLAAAAGEPGAQGAMGMRYAYGLHEASAWHEDGIAAFGEVGREGQGRTRMVAPGGAGRSALNVSL